MTKTLTAPRTAFRPVGEVTADKRYRIAFGKAKVPADSRYLMAVSETGEILLTPLASIPARELDVWENPELLASIMRGLAEAAEGKTMTWDEVFGDDADDDETES